MRVYKFRGWDSVGNKGWVYGDLVHNQRVTKTGLEPRTMVGGYEVDPLSVSLWIGRNDKHGKMIYEGDMLDVYYGEKHVFNATVVWNENALAFLLYEGDGCYSYFVSTDTNIEISYIITGNVYENNRK